MVIKTFYKTREDGVELFITRDVMVDEIGEPIKDEGGDYIPSGNKIRNVETGEIYDEAIDVAETTFEYEPIKSEGDLDDDIAPPKELSIVETKFRLDQEKNKEIDRRISSKYSLAERIRILRNKDTNVQAWNEYQEFLAKVTAEVNASKKGEN